MSSRPSFTLFSRLPTELRLEIWGLSIEERVVSVIYNPRKDRCTTWASVPAVLQACHESRTETLRLYRKQFGTKSHESRIYFCAEKDVLHIPRPPKLGYANPSRSWTELVKDTDNVINLALDYDAGIARHWELYNNYILVQSFPKLEQLTLALEKIVPQRWPYAWFDLLGDWHEACWDSKRIFAQTKAAYLYGMRREVPGPTAKDPSTPEPLQVPPIVLMWKSWGRWEEYLSRYDFPKRYMEKVLWDLVEGGSSEEVFGELAKI
ncbi:hypothetical protein F5Y16DRAFT_57931 [Xylariaceae sp. FL0255]|nr:hypothetical protein F5Y16DRAFT_57931 [Xylariaceae sp. FL0255]